MSSFASLLGKHKKTKRRRAEKKRRRRTMAAAGEDGGPAGAVLDSSLSVEDRVRVLRQRRRRSPPANAAAGTEAKAVVPAPEPSSLSSSSSSSSVPPSLGGAAATPTALATTLPPTTPRKTLALMFIVIDTLPYEDVWRQWIGDRDIDGDSSRIVSSCNSHGKNEPTRTHNQSNGHNNSNSSAGNVTATETPENNPNVRVFVHAKFPERVRSQWLRSRLIGQSFKPAWGSVEITRAMLALVEGALTAVPADVAPDMRLVFASESCLPIVPLNVAARALWSQDASWLDVKSKPRNGYNGSAQWVPIEKSAAVPAECVCKSDQWVALTRKHAALVCGLPATVGHTDMWQAFRKSCASDEMYFATLLCCAIGWCA